MGHLMTAACIHYRATGKTNFLNIAKGVADFLYDFYKKLRQNWLEMPFVRHIIWELSKCIER